MMLVQFSCSWENGSGSENIDVCLPYQVLDVIAPPYTSDFVQLFLPILENDSIAGTIRTEGEHDPVAEFIGQSLLPSFSWPKTVYVIKYFPFAQLKYNYHSAPFQLTANPTSSWWTENDAGWGCSGNTREGQKAWPRLWANHTLTCSAVDWWTRNRTIEADRLHIDWPAILRSLQMWRKHMTLRIKRM